MKAIEPFKILGIESTIWTSDQAIRVCVSATKYLFAFVALMFGLAILSLTELAIWQVPPHFWFIYGTLLLLVVSAIRFRMSRVASIILLVILASTIIKNIFFLDGPSSPINLVMVAFLLASIRSVQATFAFHRTPDNANKQPKPTP